MRVVKYEDKEGKQWAARFKEGDQASKIEYEIDCDDGRICCRYILGSDITKEYYSQIDMEWVLQVHCGQLHRMSVDNFRKIDGDNPLELMAYMENTRFIAPGYIYKDAIYDLYMDVVNKANQKYGVDRYVQKCAEYDIMKDCKGLSQVQFEPEYAVTITQHKEFLRDILAGLWKYYDDNNLCIKVLFV